MIISKEIDFSAEEERIDRQRSALDRARDLKTQMDAELDSAGVKQEDEVRASLDTMPIMSHHETVVKISQKFNINATDARKRLENYPMEFKMQDMTVPEIVKALRRKRRELKGDDRIKMSKAIETVISGYADHLSKSIDSIYWIRKYKYPLTKMRFTETDLAKLNTVTSENDRREIIDSLCKYWEAELDANILPYNAEFCKLDKEMRQAKREFRSCISKIADIRTTPKEQVEEFILKTVCEEQGLTARQVHDRMPKQFHRKTSPQMISKMVKKLEVTSINGRYYKLPGEIKKNIYAYTAAFIDSDGYITVDRNMNPRVGLVATGERGKAFMLDIHKELGIGKLHLDQKSPQGTRPVNRLNFYSQNEVYELLSKCLPHFRMKKPNAELLIELIRMKKSHKKQSWYRERCQEIFKLMKYENHKDHVGFDFVKEGIDIETVAKLHDNCKMGLMDDLESVLKSDLDDAINDLENIEEKYQLTDKEWDSLDDASDYLFEHKGPEGEEE
tara:strand:+ start:2570 stop:4078 length:1509 start_codon:yes stop_codon:yes gene_type:complete